MSRASFKIRMTRRDRSRGGRAESFEEEFTGLRAAMKRWDEIRADPATFYATFHIIADTALMSHTTF